MTIEEKQKNRNLNIFCKTFAIKIQLERDKKQAEEDKEMAVQALEQRSREFFQEREQKKRLEEKIRLMNSQLLIGGQKIEETVQFRNALEQEQKKIRSQYEDKLKELEKERTQIEQDKAQVDKYKQLLLKQRDIMIALTTRLNERDENILQLQEELDAYDRIHKETEDAFEIKNKRVYFLENFIKEKNIPLPKQEIISAEKNRKNENNLIAMGNTNTLFNENQILDLGKFFSSNNFFLLYFSSIFLNKLFILKTRKKRRKKPIKHQMKL